MTMRQIRKGCVVSAALLLALLSMYGPHATPVSGGPTKDVVVTNTSANPVPVTVSGTGSGTVQATQSGPWTVGISGTPRVTMPTHLGVQAGSLVALEYRNISTGASGCSPDDTICDSPTRILPNGNRVAFAVPSGMVLVITDIHWTASGDDEGNSATVYAASIGYTSSALFNEVGHASFTDHSPPASSYRPCRPSPLATICPRTWAI